MDANKLKAKILEKELSIAKVSKMIGVNKHSLYRKLNNKEKITINDAVKIKEVLELSDLEALEIFLS